MNAPLTEIQKHSLLRLLSDEEETTVSLLKRQLVDRGEGAVPEMELWMKEAKGSPAELHLREVINQLKFGQCHSDFLELCAQLSQEHEMDLEDAVFLLASTEYPSVKMQTYRTLLDDIASDVRLQLARDGNPSEIRALSTVIHDLYRFQGNKDHYYEADNSYFNRVLERRMGIPLTLSLLYMIIGARLDMPIRGVALPGHFIVSWRGKYFDPFNRGRMLLEEDCARMVEYHKQDFHPEHLLPASNRQIIGRMIRNLIRVYEIEEDRNRHARMTRYLRILDGE